MLRCWSRRDICRMDDIKNPNNFRPLNIDQIRDLAAAVSEDFGENPAGSSPRTASSAEHSESVGMNYCQIDSPFVRC